jgi:hypothetical protein
LTIRGYDPAVQFPWRGELATGILMPEGFLMTQADTGPYSSEQMYTLRKILDLIWMELRASGDSNFSGPTDPDALRDEIARRAMIYFNAGENPDNITQSVLSSFGLESEGLKLI